MRTFVGFLAALAVAVLTTIIGKLTGWHLTFLAGWWGCMACSAACSWFDRTYSRRPA